MKIDAALAECKFQKKFERWSATIGFANVKDAIEYYLGFNKTDEEMAYLPFDACHDRMCKISGFRIQHVYQKARSYNAPRW